MDEDIKQIDVGIVIQAFGYYKIDEVWKQYCEEERICTERAYWRSVFFEAYNEVFNFSQQPVTYQVPTGKEFVQMCVEFAEPFSN